MTDQEFIDFVKSHKTMSSAAAALGVTLNTFARKAKRLNCYNTNQGSKGVAKSWVAGRAIPIEEIFNGNYPQFQSYKLKKRLYKEGFKTNVCEICGISQWNGKSIECELDHIDGVKTNHSLDNLRIVCPNCHSQTETFRFKRGRGENGKHKVLKMPIAVGSSPSAPTSSNPAVGTKKSQKYSLTKSKI